MCRDGIAGLVDGNHLKKPKPGRFQSTEDEHPVQRVLVNKFGAKASVNEPRVLFLPPPQSTPTGNLTNMSFHLTPLQNCVTMTLPKDIVISRF
nr:MAG TPA: hypothetical protein [Caudoviricetes sp.]